MSNNELERKQLEFNKAMEVYARSRSCFFFNHLISIVNVCLQFLLVSQLYFFEASLLLHLLIFILAYFAADFINGLVHLYMDNNSHYELPAGPFVANFHLHHLRPRYQKRALPLVYYYESGSKVWLVPIQLLALFLIFLQISEAGFSLFLIYFSVLSSVAEVSHYLCHSVSSRWVTVLGDCRILLSRKHHAKHHGQDNCNYAFLNGLTDPLINLVAQRFFKGYKKTTDLHYARYDANKLTERL